jgi:hypothetical protein
MIQRPTLLRAAGLASLGTIVALVAAGIAFGLFLNGAGAVFGPVNDVLVVVCLALLAIIVFGIHALVRDRTGAWFSALSVLALAGIVLASTGQLLLVAGAIRLEASFVTGGSGILPVIAWVVAAAAIALRTDALPARLGWSTVLALVSIVALSIGTPVLPAVGLLILSVALLAALVAWLLALAWTFLVWAVRLPGPADAPPISATSGVPSAS